MAARPTRLTAMVGDAADREQSSRKTDVAADQARGDDVTSECAHLIRLLHRLNPTRIGSRFKFWRELIGAGRFDHEIGAGARSSSCGIPASGP